MGNIVLLDDTTINQIAAGEVVERPASVVKELMENSIDAGATSITVEIKNGGIKQIRIIDNGCGMTEDDLEFAFERHATSKIRKAEDLEVVKSMGFRGEALASIASIAHVEMVSKTENDEVGNKIVLEGGLTLQKEEAGAKTGTTITINNLFYNTPVRYKFLKKDFTEAGYIEDVVSRIAIANPNIAIKLVNEHKTIIQTPGNGDLKSVIYGLYGKDITDNLLPVEYEYENIKVSGFVGKPEIARGNRSYQMFFVNKRFIKDKTLSSAIEQAFKGLLPIGKYGVAIINIEIEPHKIDVNVHPTKLEIRFQEEQSAFKAVYHAIKEALLKEDITRNTSINEEEKAITNVMPKEILKTDELAEKSLIEKKDPQEKSIVNKTEHKGLFDLFRKKQEVFIENQTENAIEQIYNKAENVEEKNEEQEEKKEAVEVKQEERVVAESVEDNIPKDFNQMYNETFGKRFVEDKEDNKNYSLFEESEEYRAEKTYKYCGSIFSTYIIIEMSNEIYIIDQHAAHERIKYEQVKKNFYDGGEKESQMMLLPDIINLTHKEKNIVKENMDLFKKAGFIIEEFGDNTIRLIGVPSMCMNLDTKELFLDILDAIGSVAITAVQEKEDKFIATVACKAAVKANRELTKEEVDNLMKELLKLSNPFTCPHGRPTAIKMTKIDIEKKFERR